MSWTANTNPYIYHRVRYIVIAGAACICSIIMSLIYLQIYAYDTYTHHGMCNFTRYETINAPRGEIVDCHGRQLATNRPIITLSWHGTEQLHWTPEQRSLLRLLEYTYDVSLIQNTDLLACERTGRSYLLAYDTSLETISAISEQFPHMPNLDISTAFKRYYPLEKQAAHIIGHINKTQHGQTGIERLCDSSLTGHAGYRKKYITATGKTITQHEVIPPIAGTTVHTTLDIDLQQCAEQAFLDQSHTGAIICIDGTNGDIKALVSRPSFDPNAFTNAIDQATWDTWQHQYALLNRACNAVYPPASIFKLVTAATALEEQCITPASTWYCTGTTRFAGRTYACNKQSGHQAMTIADAIAHSCNIPFYEIGKQLDIDTIASYSRTLGLNVPTGILLGENSGLVPTHAWKMNHVGENWWQGETLAATIGQSYLLVTPLQIANMINTICQGYHVRPRILIDEPLHITRLDLSLQTQEFLQNALRSVVTQGRARDIGHLEQQKTGLTLYAKTGTAQTSHKARRKDGKQFREHGWFVTHVRYADHTPITLVVLLEHTGSSRIAGYTARNFIRSYCDICDKKNRATSVTRDITDMLD